MWLLLLMLLVSSWLVITCEAIAQRLSSPPPAHPPRFKEATRTLVWGPVEPVGTGHVWRPASIAELWQRALDRGPGLATPWRHRFAVIHLSGEHDPATWHALWAALQPLCRHPMTHVHWHGSTTNPWWQSLSPHSTTLDWTPTVKPSQNAALELVQWAHDTACAHPLSPQPCVRQCPLSLHRERELRHHYDADTDFWIEPTESGVWHALLLSSLFPALTLHWPALAPPPPAAHVWQLVSTRNDSLDSIHQNINGSLSAGKSAASSA